MIIVDTKGNRIEVSNRNWPLAESLFLKWGHDVINKPEVRVVDINDIAPELSAWGIPWKRK